MFDVECSMFHQQKSQPPLDSPTARPTPLGCGEGGAIRVPVTYVKGLTERTKKNLARAIMWTYHGKTFPAPTWDLGMAPAGSLYSTVEDQAKLLSFLFATGQTADGKQLLKKETLESMWKIQFPVKGEKAGGLKGDDREQLEVMAGVSAFPMRVKCATLAWHAMKAALANKATARTE